MKKKCLALLSATVFVLVLAHGMAHAHFSWLNIQRYMMQENSNVALTAGWGHLFPFDGFLVQDHVEDLFVLAPDDSKIAMKATSELEFASEAPLAKAGTHIVAGQRKTGFYTKTTNGGMRQSKIGLDNVISCSLSTNSMKAIVTVGVAGGKADATVGHPLEIAPLADPANLKIGDYLPLRVLLNGQPHSTSFNATYAGFSMEPNVYAYAAKTDDEGKGRLRILAPGMWLIRVEYQEPYHDLNECDVRTYVATLTFQID